MKNEHILDILDEKAFNELEEAEINSIKTHAAKCSNCLQAYEAAKISSLLLKTSVTQNFEPSPFFQTRLMANLRERQIKISPILAFARIWKASGTLVAMMVTAVVALIALTVFAPNYNRVAAVENDSADFVILEGKMPNRELSSEQVFQIVYGADNITDK